MGLFDWLFGKSQKQKELEEKQKAEETRRHLEQEAQRLQAAKREEAKLREKEAEKQQKLRALKALEEQARQQQEAKLQREKLERERQANILRQQKLDEEKQAAEKKQQVLREAQRQQAEQERLAEERRVALLKRQQEEAQRNFCETDTTYCADLNRLYERNPANFKFATIRSLTSDCGVWQELENGVKQLETYEQLNQYIFSYGLMHQAKLQQAYHSIFSNNHLPLSGQPIEIIDYGCGQGIGTICLVDYIKEQTNRNCNIEKVKLIEPSVLALKRAVLNTRYSLKSFNQPENIVAVNKELDDINSQDIDTQANVIKIHIFSNIIDVEDFDLYQLYHKIQSTQTGMNIFMCVSPNIMESRNQRLDRFQQYFVSQSSFTPIASRESDIPNPRNPDKSYKRYERIFKVQLGEIAQTTVPVILTRSSRFIGDDDLPF